MKVKVEFLDDAGKTLMVETHHRRNDTFNVDRTDHIMSGESNVFDVPASGRLIVNMPTATEAAVYSREQAASISPSAQKNSDVEPDAPDPMHGKPTRKDLDDALAKLPDDQTDPDYVVASMKQHWGDVFTDADEKTVRSKVVKRTPPQGGVAKPQGMTTAANAPQVGTAATPTGVKTTTMPNTTPATGSPPQGGSTEKK